MNDKPTRWTNPTTTQEKVILALMRGHHLSKEELEVAKQAIHSMTKELESRIK